MVEIQKPEYTDTGKAMVCNWKENIHPASQNIFQMNF